MTIDRWAAAATVLAGASAAVSAWWLFGGTTGLDSLGGGLEQLARERSAPALVVLTIVIIAKLLAAALACAMTRSWVARPWARLATWGGGALAVYGIVLVAGGAVGLVMDAEGADRAALWGHTLLWDPWFAIWGIALMLAGRGAQTTSATTSSTTIATTPSPRAGITHRGRGISWTTASRMRRASSAASAGSTPPD